MSRQMEWTIDCIGHLAMYCNKSFALLCICSVLVKPITKVFFNQKQMQEKKNHTQIFTAFKDQAWHCLIGRSEGICQAPSKTHWYPTITWALMGGQKESSSHCWLLGQSFCDPHDIHIWISASRKGILRCTCMSLHQGVNHYGSKWDHRSKCLNCPAVLIHSI